MSINLPTIHTVRSKRQSQHEEFTRVLGLGGFVFSGRGRSQCAKVGDWQVTLCKKGWTVHHPVNGSRVVPAALIHPIVNDRLALSDI